MRVPWLPKETIAKHADKLLAKYGEILGQEIKPPIPVEGIIQNYLGLKLGFLDFEKTHNLKGVLGATYVEARLICVNEDLTMKGAEGRRTFTCAHEVGHWMLHRHLVKQANRNGLSEDVIFCRSVDAKKPLEWQADYFAASLLMPEKKILEAFKRLCDTETLEIVNVASSFGGTALCIDPCVQNWHLIADVVRQEGGFTNVSKQAMIFRLLDLGLVVNHTRIPLGRKASYYNQGTTFS